VLALTVYVPGSAPGYDLAGAIESVIGEIDAGPIEFEKLIHPGSAREALQPLTPLFLVNGDQLPKRAAAPTSAHAASPRRSLAANAPMRRYAAILYQTLHRLDDRGFDWIAVERLPNGRNGSGAGSLDRASSRL